MTESDGIEPEEHVRTLFSLCGDALGESDETVSREKVPGTFSEPIRDGDGR
jgi:hypothetical protein